MAESKQGPRKTDPNVRLLGQVAFTTVLWAATFVVTKSDRLASATSLPARAALVAIGIGGFLPVVFVYAKSIRMQTNSTSGSISSRSASRSRSSASSRTASICCTRRTSSRNRRRAASGH